MERTISMMDFLKITNLNSKKGMGNIIRVSEGIALFTDRLFNDYYIDNMMFC